MKSFFKKSEFTSNAIILMTGTAIAQAIPVFISPILTRLYSPHEFGVFAIYMAVCSILSVVATGRYEQVVMLPQKDEDAANVVILSFIVTTLFSLLLLVIVVLFNSGITSFLGNSEISGWLYLIPFSVLSMGVYNTLNYWLNRKKNFTTMSTNRIMQGSVTASGQLVFGKFGASSVGLIGGFFIGWLTANLFAARSYQFRSFPIRLSSIIAHAKLYKDYPRVSAPGALLDCASVQAPIFFLTKGYEAATVGFFSLAMRAISAPASIISYSIGQVYFQKISVLAYTNSEAIFPEVVQSAKKLAIFAVAVFSPFIFFGSEIFEFIFGKNWRVAGDYVQIISPALLVRFIVSPLSTIFLATGNVRLGTMWQMFYFISTIIVMTSMKGKNISTFLVGFVINEIIMYLLYFYFIVRASRKVLTR